MDHANKLTTATAAASVAQDTAEAALATAEAAATADAVIAASAIAAAEANAAAAEEKVKEGVERVGRDAYC